MEIVEPIEEESLTEVSPLPSPAELRRRLPFPEAGMRFVRAARQTLADVLHGRDARLVVRSDIAQKYFGHLLIKTRKRNGRVLVRHSFFNFGCLQ